MMSYFHTKMSANELWNKYTDLISIEKDIKKRIEITKQFKAVCMKKRNKNSKVSKEFYNGILNACIGIANGMQQFKDQRSI